MEMASERNGLARANDIENFREDLAVIADPVQLSLLQDWFASEELARR